MAIGMTDSAGALAAPPGLDGGPTPQWWGADAEELRVLCRRYHGDKGSFAYAAFAWANREIYDDALPVPLLQWGLTAYGACIGMTRSRQTDAPVITLHPTIWFGPVGDGKRAAADYGPRYALDVVIHELLHVYIMYSLRSWGTPSKSSHDSAIWCREIERLSPKLDLLPFAAAPTKRRKVDGRLRRVAPEGCAQMSDVAQWPHPFRRFGYYDSGEVPFTW